VIASVTVFLCDPSFDDRCSLCHEIVHTTFGFAMLENRDTQIAVGMPVEPPQCCYFSQIQAHTNYAVGRAAIFSNNDVCFSHEMALAALRPFQKYVHCVVFDTNFNIMAHFQLKI
jgi:hypothetical protein